MKTEPVSPNSGAQRVADDNRQSMNETLAQVDHDPQTLDTGADKETKPLVSNNDQPNAPPMDNISKLLASITANPSTRTTPNSTTTGRITRSSSNRSSATATSKTPLFKTLTPIQKTTRKRKLCSIRYKLKQKSVNELTDLYNSTSDTDFRTLMMEVYHENCMDRLEEWEERL